MQMFVDVVNALYSWFCCWNPACCMHKLHSTSTCTQHVQPIYDVFTMLSCLLWSYYLKVV